LRINVHSTFPHEAVSVFADLKLPREKGVFIAEGDKLVTRLLESDVEINSLYLTEEHFETRRLLIEGHIQSEPVEIFIAPKKAMERIVGFTLHQGILASAKIPKEKTLDELIANSSEPQLFIILDTIVDAENIGSLYRTALAMSVTAIIIDDRCVSPWIRRAVRVSMGAVYKLPTITMDVLTAIGLLKASEISVYAAAIGNNMTPVWSNNFQRSIAIILGSEGHGIREEILEVCSDRIEIPMAAEVTSLNVGVAQAMILYEVVRQRSTLPPGIPN
jgi:tRNA G18 (ribose-2'-O)-methylase SpoU